MKVYLAGRITGDTDYKSKFKKYEEMYNEVATVLNPAENPAGMSNADYANISIAMINAADYVVFLPDWKESLGANLEHAYCKYIGKPVRYE